MKRMRMGKDKRVKRVSVYRLLRFPGQREKAKSPRPTEAGMTLIEIIIVMALIAGFMGLVLGNLGQGMAQAKERETRIAFGQIKSALMMYKLNGRRYPTSDQGIRALIEDPGSPNWRGPYSEPELLIDPWGTEIKLESDGRAFQLISAGDDMQFGTDDDLTFPDKGKAEGPLGG